MTETMMEKGLRVRKEVMGSKNVEARIAAGGEFMAPLQGMISQWAYGEVWGREGLPRKTRSLMVLAMMAALNRPDEFRVHVGGAIANGCTPDEIREALIQVAIYCGIPASMDAHKIAMEELRGMGHAID